MPPATGSVFIYSSSQVDALIKEGIIGDANTLTISTTDKDLDKMFEGTLDKLSIDFDDKTTLMLTWKGAH